MSKKIELIIEIDSEGKISVTTKGTVGKECLEVMEFLDKIDGISVLEVVHNEDMGKENNVLIKNKIIDKS